MRDRRRGLLFDRNQADAIGRGSLDLNAEFAPLRSEPANASCVIREDRSARVSGGLAQPVDVVPDGQSTKIFGPKPVFLRHSPESSVTLTTEESLAVLHAAACKKAGAIARTGMRASASCIVAAFSTTIRSGRPVR